MLCMIAECKYCTVYIYTYVYNMYMHRCQIYMCMCMCISDGPTRFLFFFFFSRQGEIFRVNCRLPTISWARSNSRWGLSALDVHSSSVPSRKRGTERNRERERRNISARCIQG